MKGHYYVLLVVGTLLMGGIDCQHIAVPAMHLDQPESAADKEKTPHSRQSIADTRISVGYQAGSNQFPWMALISLPGGTCGGVLVSGEYVLTAAHCLSRFDQKTLQENAKVVVGLDNAQESATCSACETFKVKRYHVHPKYNPNGFDINSKSRIISDIGLIRLDSKSNFTAASLGQQDPKPDTVAYVIGWGETAATEKSSSDLRYTTVEITPPEECSGFKPKDFFDQDTSICAASYGTWAQGKTASACSGDSGGPLVNMRASGKVLGVVSYSILPQSTSKCGEFSHTVFTSVSQHRKWIESVVSSS